MHPLLLLLALSAQSPALSAAPFKPIEFVVGSCWIGTFPDTARTDEHCFEWVFDRTFVRDRHVVRGGGPYQGESIYYWDPVEKRLAFTYWNSDGDVLPGYAEPTGSGVRFFQTYHTSNGDVEIRAIWTPAGPDAYRVETAQRAGADWKPLWTMELRRK